MASPTVPRRDIFARSADHARDWWPYVVNAVGFAGLGLTGAADRQGHIVIPFAGWTLDKAPVAWVSAILAAIGFIGTISRGRKLTAVQRDLTRAEGQAATTERTVEALIRTELGLLSDSLKHFSTERVSLFLPVPDGFRLVARWSRAPGLLGTTRTIYPPNEGCLSSAWAAGSAAVTDLPDPLSDIEGWLAAQRQWGLSDETALSMTMRSRTYAAFRIEAAQPGKEALGVIVFESQLVPGGSAAKLRESELRTAIQGGEAHRLRVYLEQMAQLLAPNRR
jgi:hypothetical protein